MMNGYPPYMDIEKNGEIIGFDVDIAKAIEKEIKQPIIIKDLGNLSSLFLALETEAIDCIMSGLDITKERAKEYEIIYYHGEKNNHAYIVTLKNGPTSEDFTIKNWKIAVEPGSSNESILKNHKNLRLFPLLNYVDMMLQLKNKNIDGFLLDVSQIKRFQDLNDPELSFFKIEIPEELITNGIGIVLKRGNFGLKEKLQNAITHLIHNNIINELAHRWKLL